LNLQGNTDDLGYHLHYVQVGTWNTGKLSLNTSEIRFLSDQRPLEQINVRRFCSESCQVGHVKVISFSFFFSIIPINFISEIH
jgi:hypothetical protein